MSGTAAIISLITPTGGQSGQGLASPTESSVSGLFGLLVAASAGKAELGGIVPNEGAPGETPSGPLTNSLSTNQVLEADFRSTRQPSDLADGADRPPTETAKATTSHKPVTLEAGEAMMLALLAQAPAVPPQVADTDTALPDEAATATGDTVPRVSAPLVTLPSIAPTAAPEAASPAPTAPLKTAMLPANAVGASLTHADPPVVASSATEPTAAADRPATDSQTAIPVATENGTFAFPSLQKIDAATASLTTLAEIKTPLPGIKSPDNAAAGAKETQLAMLESVRDLAAPPLAEAKARPLVDPPPAGRPTPSTETAPVTDRPISRAADTMTTVDPVSKSPTPTVPPRAGEVPSTSASGTAPDSSAANIGWGGSTSPSQASVPPTMTVIRAPQHAPAGHVPTEQIAIAIAHQARQGTNRFEIRLDPPELGRIDVRLEVTHDGRVNAALTVDRQETLDLLARDARMLMRTLSDAGLTTDQGSLNFALRDQTGQHTRQGGGEAPHPSGHTDSETESAPASVLAPTLTASLEPGRLDLRV